MLKIREANSEDFDQIWPIFHDIAQAGETYAYETDTNKQQAFSLWIELPNKTFICEEEGKILGTYYIKTNQSGPGKHICNCGYMVSSSARGKGIATLMCNHSQDTARQLGYKAMQFNFVASSNKTAVGLWLKLGFEIVGTLPKAFNHPSKGYIDAFVMYKWLDDNG